MGCDEVRALLEEHGLGALDPAEEAEVARHLVGCAACRQLAAEWGEIAARLPAALALASPHRPPPELKDRVLAKLGATRLGQHAAPRVPTPADASPPTAPAAPPAMATRAPRRWRPRLANLAAVAALVLLALSVAWGIRLNSALARERQLNADFAQLAEQIGAQQEIILEVLDSPRVAKATLRQPPGAPPSNAPPYGKLYVRPDLPHVVAMINRLPPPPPGSGYHLWLVRDGRSEFAGVLATNDAGFGLLVFDAGADGPVYSAARVTLQPLGDAAEGGQLVLTWER